MGTLAEACISEFRSRKVPGQTVRLFAEFPLGIITGVMRFAAAESEAEIQVGNKAEERAGWYRRCGRAET